tara:strand:+ start:297 stop:833 length:537 start_codon:yes stop_codon:yes gene_type:complete
MTRLMLCVAGLCVAAFCVFGSLVVYSMVPSGFETEERTLDDVAQVDRVAALELSMQNYSMHLRRIEAQNADLSVALDLRLETMRKKLLRNTTAIGKRLGTITLKLDALDVNVSKLEVPLRKAVRQYLKLTRLRISETIRTSVASEAKPLQDRVALLEARLANATAAARHRKKKKEHYW